MDEYIDWLGDVVVYSTLDTNSDYWQVEIDQEDGEKTAFASNDRLFKGIRILYGLKGAPGTFQRATDEILSTVHCQFKFVYLGAILIVLKSPEAHIEHVRHVLALLRHVVTTMNGKKFGFLLNTVNQLCHVIRLGQLPIQQHAIDSTQISITERTSRNYDYSWACATCFDDLYPTSCVVRHHWAESCKKTT